MAVRIQSRATGKSPVAAAQTKPAPKQHAFFTVADLARRWSLSERHIRRLIDQGDLIVHRIGRSVRVSQSNIALFEARCLEDL